MADGVEFHDFSIQVKDALESACISFLHEAAGELEAQTKRNFDQLSGQWHAQQKNAWEYHVDESKLEATVGNPMQQAIWTEFGTGEYAANGDGRKGYWVYVKGDEGSANVSTGGKSYTLEEAKRIVAMMRADGLDAHLTKGQKPKRPFQNAFTTVKPKIIKRAETIFGNKLK